MNRWAMLLGVTLLLGCSGTQPPNLVEYDATVTQAMQVAKRVAPDGRLKVPMLLVFDGKGMLAKQITGWDDGTIGQIGEALLANGEGVSLEDVRRDLGRKDAGSLQTIVAISVGKQCPPCVLMENEIGALAGQKPKVLIEIYRPAPGQPKT